MDFKAISILAAGALLFVSPALAGITAKAHVDTSGVNMQPAYPATALAGHEQGAVIVAAAIREDGTVKNVAIAASSGYDDLDNAAANAVYKWKFVPAMVDGNSVEGDTQVKIVFNPPDEAQK